MPDPIIKVKEGKLKGKLCETENGNQFYSFKGIPYAKPPVNDLRFALPVAPEAWEGVRDATKDCNICAQYDTETLTVIGDEDCLYLNVYTPKLPSTDQKLLPVMVFIHGGGFVFGSGTDDSVHGPDYIVEKDVVVVSFNFRLGVLGFLALDCKEAPGNMGLRDQVQALKWIQTNISNFSGDPNNVTIFGVSAGAASVEFLLLSPLSKGLFHKAIAQAGSTLVPWALNRNVKQLAFKIPSLKGRKITDKDELILFLKQMPLEDLIKLSMAALATESEHGKGGLHFGFVPTIEKASDWEPFLSEPPEVILKRGDFAKVPYITGFCSREGLLMLAVKKKILDELVSDKNFVDFLPFDLDDSQKSVVHKKCVSVYLDNQNPTNPDDFAVDFFTDVDFLGGIYVALSLIAKNNSPVYFYEFSYDGGMNYLKKKRNIDRPGACHGDDGGYLIKTNNLFKNLTDRDYLVRDRMVEMWTNFAKCGDPTPNINKTITTKWMPVSETGLVYLCVNSDLKMKEKLHTERMKLFNDLYTNNKQV